MIAAIAIGFAIAYIVYTFMYSVYNDYKDAAVLIAVAAIMVALMLWCEFAWSMIE